MTHTRAAIPAPAHAKWLGKEHISLWTRADSVWDPAIGREVITGDYYFMAELKEKGGEVHTCIDVGGHIGSFGALVKGMWPDAEVTSYEASPENHSLIIDNAADHGFNVVTAALVGKVPECGTIQFCTASVLPGNHNTGGGTVAYSPTSYTEVPVRALPAEDIFNHLKKGTKVIDLMKFDCEGSERQILTSLSEQGLMKHVGWIRGEYHGGQGTIDILRKALDPTHESMYNHHAGGIGFFIAHNRDVPVPYEH